METSFILQALVKDLAEHMRPMVADLVRQELTATSNTWQDGERTLETIAEKIDLQKLAQHVDMSALAGELTGGQLNDIAGDIDLADLARELDADNIAEKLDVSDAVREFFQDNTFSIRA